MKREDHQAAIRSGERPLHVLVVDDSAVVRQVVGGLLREEPGFTVETASDPIIAMDKMKKARPNVILLDLELPRMHGLDFLAKIMAEDPLPVVICSSLTGSGAEAAIRATEGGAVAIVTKPKLGVKDFLHESAVMLIDTIRGAARARRPRFAAALPTSTGTASHIDPDAVVPTTALGWTTDKIVGIGASTGGTEALRGLLTEMPPDCPGLVIVQHMPEVFTAAFAARLNQVCRIEVKEAASRDRVRQGRALIAPGNRHTELRRSGAHYTVAVSDGPLVSRHRPSVDHLFRSIAKAAGSNALGVIMTGMGRDGAQGLLEMKEAGALTMAQDEASCVVFGMPGSAVELGAADEVVPLAHIPARILRRIHAIN